ncbi:STAS domain-containing protein [Streptacidiphilus sp. PB12-B1b]|uniref:STAS domain-containing protein n=1 Tax=Streptacidiphilus sp. PB12-B1b TaxID=2705012 RepID=UPI0015F95D97|nr:STAS domain-containing protein [Streptacidiphilus sp. PB12-B1b]QMU76826.1 STAS domain-containing protein [Streptacidiphilus sp. PB12-B1b]
MDSKPSEHAWVLALRGELDFHSVVQLREAADAVLAEPQPAPLVVVDCTALEYCDSTGITGLIQIHQRLAGHGGVLRLAAVPASVARIFELTGLDQVIAVHGTAYDALSAEDGAQEPHSQDPASLAHVAGER